MGIIKSIATSFWSRYRDAVMASSTLKDIPEDLHALLKAEADANFRSPTQEALARIDRSFAFDEQLSTETVNRLMDESIASGRFSANRLRGNCGGSFDANCANQRESPAVWFNSRQFAKFVSHLYGFFRNPLSTTHSSKRSIHLPAG